MSVRAYIGLGSNLDHPAMQVQKAIEAIRVLDAVEVMATSSLYHSKPMGPQNQPDFVNAVISIDTGLSAQGLLRALQQIEQDHGRVRTVKWGPRVIDLDILLYGDSVIDTPELTVPHPGMEARDFVMIPLNEVLQAPTEPRASASG